MIIPILLGAMLSQQVPTSPKQAAAPPIIVNMNVGATPDNLRELLQSCVANKLRAMQGIEVVIDSPEGSDLEARVDGISFPISNSPSLSSREIIMAAIYVGIPLAKFAAFSGASEKPKPGVSVMIYFGTVKGQHSTTSSTCDTIAATIDNNGIDTVRVMRRKP